MPLGHIELQHVSLEARRGATYRGAISLDDISFMDCKPPTPPHIGKNLTF